MRLEREKFTVYGKVKETIRRWKMVEEGDLVLLAVSGGPDSLVMLDVMVALSGNLGVRLEVLHVDHGLRRESAEEARFVEEVASFYRLPFHLEKVDVEAERRAGRSPEDAARRARYRAFEEVAGRRKARRVATGHTADDRVETLLLRLITGAGLEGLGSVPPVRSPYIRPLLEVWRKEVEAYAALLPFSPREDASNRDLSIPRNRVRRQLLPFLEREYNPAVRRVLFREADILYAAGCMLREQAEEALERMVHRVGERLEVEVEKLESMPLALRREVVASLLRRAGKKPSFEMVEGILDNLEGGGSAGLDIGGGWRAGRVYGRLVIGPAPGEGPPPEVLVSGEGVHELDPSGLALHVDIIPGGGLDPRRAAPRPTVACLDADRLRFPLLVRPVRPGDRFHPLGAPGRKKMQDFLVDEKVPVEERTRVRVLESGGEIAWVLGMRIDERFKVREGTRRVAVLRLSQGGGREG